MIEEGTDGLSRGVWLSPQRCMRSSILEAALALRAVPYSLPFQRWVLTTLGHPVDTNCSLYGNTTSWAFPDIFRKISLWIVSPELARQALVQFLEIWVESPTNTEGIFVIPRVLQRDWGNLSRSVFERGVFHPTLLPDTCRGRYSSLIPFVILHVPPHQRLLPPPRLDKSSATMRFPRWWHAAQADHLPGL
jgi:hypothetical protein